MERPPDILLALAARYERSRGGRTGSAAQDFLIDYEDLLREGDSERGEARLCAERDLADAEARSLLLIERHRRTGLPLRVRFSLAREEALYERLGLVTPGNRRQTFSGLFLEAVSYAVPLRWENGWRSFCTQCATAAAAGESVAPFSREQPDETREILQLLPRLLAWEGEALRRYASSRLCADSKRLEVLQARLVACLIRITEGAVESLEDLGILENERAVIVHGPLRLRFADGVFDLGLLTAPARIDRRDLRRAVLETPATRCLTVENLSVLHALAQKAPGALLASSGSEGGFAHSAIVEFLKNLPPGVMCLHCGDSDPKGFEILLSLRERTGRAIASSGMVFDSSKAGPLLTSVDRRTIARLLVSPFLTEAEKRQVQAMEAAGHKGIYEQEARPLPLPA